jgi:hypothetical protein
VSGTVHRIPVFDEFIVPSATLVRSRHTRLDDEQFTAMEPWHTVAFTRERA